MRAFRCHFLWLAIDCASFKIELDWDEEDADIDLYVIEPSGALVAWDNLYGVSDWIQKRLTWGIYLWRF